MNTFPENIAFKYPWRKYQQRVLDELQCRLDDRHLHIVAPPGSGKTVLGIEVVLRLNKPTLILAPTIAIRNQWIRRFCELFLQTTQPPKWISNNIRHPNFLTVSTYQGLHAACNNLPDDNDCDDGVAHPKTDFKNTIHQLKAQDIGVVVVDEAHHLKNEWWRTLNKVKNALNPIVVGLTATPPYDVTAAEWQRYIELNGAIDAEISVPELIAESDLCPHQDYAYVSFPSEKEYRLITDFRKNIEKLFRETGTDATLCAAIENHPVWRNPAQHLEWIYTNLSTYSSMLIFLNFNKKEIPKEHIEIIGDKEFKVPELDYEWLEILLRFYLYREKEFDDSFGEHREHLINRLRRYGVMEQREVNFRYNRRITGLLTSSIGKLEAIKDIVDYEYARLGKTLRLVILSDFIRKEFLVNAAENNTELNKIGVVSIFEKLRRENSPGVKIGILSGSVIILPTSALTALQRCATAEGGKSINSSVVPFASDYLFIHQTEQTKSNLVHWVTHLFQHGEIEVLVGTKSLLGEGWDAPAINTLILASFVGSFVLSNQMRGRAIRSQQVNREKTSNIWHLVCFDPTMPDGGNDVAMMKRRFRGFVGITSGNEPNIENGVNRLNLPLSIRQRSEAQQYNTETFRRASEREHLRRRWMHAIGKGVSLVEEIKIPFRGNENETYPAATKFYLDKTIAGSVATLLSAIAAFVQESLIGLLRNLGRLRSWEAIRNALIVLAVSGVAYFGYSTYKALRLYIKYRDIAKDLGRIGEALLQALHKAGRIQTPIENLKVVSSVDEWGAVYCHLEGGTTYEKSSFINALQEIVAPIDNPRYIIIRKSKFLLFVHQADYHSVPEVIGCNKRLAEFFREQWLRCVGECDLVFTRNVGGRKLVLKSRLHSLASALDERVERVSVWK